jgi:hypothetical protein
VSSPERAPPRASHALISAALGGLLLFGASCSSQDDSATNGAAGTAGSGGRSGAGGTSGSAGRSGSGGGAGSTGGGAPDAALDASQDGASGDGDGAGTEAGSEDSSALDATLDGGADGALDPDACLNPSGMIADASVTSQVHDPSMTLEKFIVLCNQRGGVVELICHCGGANTCKGISYDTTIGMLSEHTCRGMNTCAGYSCVIP